MSQFRILPFIFLLFITSLVLFPGCRSGSDDGSLENEDSNDDLGFDSSEEALVIADDSMEVAGKDSASGRVPLFLKITNLEDAQSPVVVIVFNSAAKFLQKNGKHKRFKIQPTGLSVALRISDLTYGTYAIAIFQDKNSNGKLDLSAIKIPKEPYAFSNNFKPRVKAPTFKDCSFVFNEKTPHLNIKMIK